MMAIGGNVKKIRITASELRTNVADSDLSRIAIVHKMKKTIKASISGMIIRNTKMLNFAISVTSFFFFLLAILLLCFER